MTPADHTNKVREALPVVMPNGIDAEAVHAALDALQTQAETAEGAVSREAYAEAVWTLTDERDLAVRQRDHARDALRRLVDAPLHHDGVTEAYEAIMDIARAALGDKPA